MIKTPKIKTVKIINNEINLTITPSLKDGDILTINEADTPSSIGSLFGPGDQLTIPFENLSHAPVDKYFMSYLDSSGSGHVEEIDNKDFHDALKFKVTLYDINKENSSKNIITGHSTPGTFIKMKSYNFMYEASETVSKTRTNNENIFELRSNKQLHPYKPFLIEAKGTYYSPTEQIIIKKTLGDKELIVNGNFKNGINDWLQHPLTAEETNFTKKDGYGNFKISGDSPEKNAPLEAVQFVVGPKSSKFRLTCEIRVHSFNNRPFHTLWLGAIVASGGGAIGAHVRHDVSQDEIGKWIKLDVQGYFTSQWQLEKYGFTSDGINEMDVRNVSMIEI